MHKVPGSICITFLQSGSGLPKSQLKMDLLKNIKVGTISLEKSLVEYEEQKTTSDQCL